MSRNDARRHLIAYDIPGDRRRDRLAKCLERHGDRVQYSVFVVDASPARIARLKSEMSTIIVAAQDSVLICDLGLVQCVDQARFAYLGRSRPIMNNGKIVILTQFARPERRRDSPEALACNHRCSCLFQFTQHQADRQALV
jgi:CRISPR-associated protein Cas2